MSGLLFDGRFHVRLISNLKSDLSGQRIGPQITLENLTKKKQKKISHKIGQKIQHEHRLKVEHEIGKKNWTTNRTCHNSHNAINVPEIF